MKGTIRYWNRAAEELYGWTKEEAVSRVVHDLLKAVFPVPPRTNQGRSYTHRPLGGRACAYPERRYRSCGGKPLVVAT
jgi:PAS domain S-box-containing protein